MRRVAASACLVAIALGGSGCSLFVGDDSDDPNLEIVVPIQRSGRVTDFNLEISVEDGDVLLVACAMSAALEASVTGFFLDDEPLPRLAAGDSNLLSAQIVGVRIEGSGARSFRVEIPTIRDRVILGVLVRGLDDTASFGNSAGSTGDNATVNQSLVTSDSVIVFGVAAAGNPDVEIASSGSPINDPILGETNTTIAAADIRIDYDTGTWATLSEPAPWAGAVVEIRAP